MTTRTALLQRLVALGILEQDRATDIAHVTATPWWLATLMAITAWIAALLLVSTFFAPLFIAGLGTGPLARGIGGALLLGIAIWLFSRGQVGGRGLFTGQMALALSLAGQVLLVSAFADFYDGHKVSWRLLWSVGLLAALAMMVPPSTHTHRTACALLACWHLGALIGPGNGLLLYGVALLAGAVAAWLGRPRWGRLTAAIPVKPVAHALTVGALVCAWLVGVEAAREALVSLAEEAHHPVLLNWLYPAGVSLVLFMTAAWLTRQAPVAVRAVVLGGAVLFIAAAWHAPGLITAAAILLVVFHACHRAWSALALLAVLLYLGEFYYSLQATLLLKSGALAASGLVLLGLRFVLHRWRERTS